MLRFTTADLERAYEAWGCTCGPAAIAAIGDMTLDEVRPYLGEYRGFMNPTMMWAALRSAGLKWSERGPKSYPAYGIARIQFEGPWTKPGVPARAAYRHTHWIAARRDRDDSIVFDINAMELGGWLPRRDWESVIAPQLVAHHKRATGWHFTHVVEVERPMEGIAP